MKKRIRKRKRNVDCGRGRLGRFGRVTRRDDSKAVRTVMESNGVGNRGRPKKATVERDRVWYVRTDGACV